MSKLRHTTQGEQTQVYIGDRPVAYMEPEDRGGYAMFDQAGNYMGSATTVEMNVVWLECHMKLGNFPRRRNVPWGKVKVGDIWISNAPENRERRAIMVTHGPTRNTQIEFDNGPLELYPDSFEITVVQGV